MKNSTHKNIRKILSIAICLCLVVSYVPIMSLTALGADGVAYINENGNFTTYTGAYTEVTSGLTAWSDGWYVVKGDVTVAERITVSGTVNLILADGAQLTANKGICVNQGNTFIVYAQSEDEAKMGKLTAKKYNTVSATIGSEMEVNCGTITINGGMITAEGSTSGAAIGSGKKSTGGKITINGGVVVASSEREGAAIGSGSLGNGGEITINGGKVTATTYGDGAAIGGGLVSANIKKNCGTIIINGGNVNARTYSYGAAIGSGEFSTGGTIIINGGIVSASREGLYSSALGAMISDNRRDEVSLELNGGIVFYDNLNTEREGVIYGDKFALTMDVLLKNGESLTIAENQTLTIAEGARFINHGNVVNNGMILNLGVIEDVNKNITGGVITGLNGVFYTEHQYKNGACTLCGAVCASHVMENGFCAHDCAGVYEPATETNDKYDINGDGNTDQVYEIANAGQLYWFAGLVNGTLADVQKNNRANAILTADIVVNKNVVDNQGNLIGNGSDFIQWTPIGAEAINVFQGNFNGNGHTVSGLYFKNQKLMLV